MDLKRLARGPLLWIVLAILLVLVLSSVLSGNGGYSKVDTSRIVQAIEAGQVQEALLKDKEQQIQVTLKEGVTIEGKSKVQADYPSEYGTVLAEDLESHVPPKAWDTKVSRGNIITSLLINLLPIVIIVFLLLFFMNQMQ